MNVSDAGLALIAEFEGFSGHLYNDPSGNCTIGYGNLIHMGPCDGRAEEQPYGNGITEAQGRAMLATKVVAYADCVERGTSAQLTQPQFDALVSFTYNVGQGSYINSPVRAAVNSGGDVCAALMLYIHGSDGVVLPGLQRRRKAECAMYHEEEHMPTPEYDELKQDEGNILKALGEFGAKLDALRTELLTQNYLLATGRDDAAKQRIEFEAAAGKVTLP